MGNGWLVYYSFIKYRSADIEAENIPLTLRVSNFVDVLSVSQDPLYFLLVLNIAAQVYLWRWDYIYFSFSFGSFYSVTSHHQFQQCIRTAQFLFNLFHAGKYLCTTPFTLCLLSPLQIIIYFLLISLLTPLEVGESFLVFIYRFCWILGWRLNISLIHQLSTKYPSY